ncbi:MAG: hypothetical protein GF398_09075 [Chitinivibrionales bacterium]|nr:hypothetical protein [Chitinivibrionales bacterium]
MRSSLHKWQNAIGLGVVSLFLFGMCSKTDEETTAPSNQNPPPQQQTQLSINVGSDTTLGSAATSYSLAGLITNPDNATITSLTVNGADASGSLANNVFTSTINLASDTTQIIAILSANGKSWADTMMIYRGSPVSQAGMAKISGTLMMEGAAGSPKTLAKKVVAQNAAGQTAVVNGVIPITGADIMFYDASSVSTDSDTSVKSDSLGNWEVELPEGNYFAFAVYFDKENLEIVTAAMADIDAVADKVTTTDTATAISDDVKPMLLTFLDAVKADDDGLFLANEVPRNLPIVMSFSEPMTRKSAGDSVSGIILGEVDVDSSDLPLVDTIPAKKLWGPNGKELRLMPLTQLTVDKTYKVVIPSSIKDLALNKLDNAYSGVFDVIEAANLPPFAVKNTSPKGGDTISLGMPVEIIFTRPIDILSLNKNFALAPVDTGVTNVKAYFESKGSAAKLLNTTPWTQGAAYKLTIAPQTRDLIGDSLDTTIVLTFTIKPKDAFQQKAGAEGQIAAFVENFMGALMAGEIDKFSQAFHANFELISFEPDSTGQVKEVRMMRDKFLAERRSDIDRTEMLAKQGMIAPVWHNISDSTRNYLCWKLVKDTTVVYFEDLGPGMNVGAVPQVFDADSNNVTDSVEFIDRGMVYDGDTLFYAPDMSKAFIDAGTRSDDPRIFGKLLKEQTDVETQEVFMEIKQHFKIKAINVETGGEAAQVMFELIEEIRYKDGKLPFPSDPNNPTPDVEKHVTAIQTKVKQEGGKWWVVQMVSKDIFQGDIQNFNQATVDTSSAFQIQNFAQTEAIEYVKPLHKATGVKTPITLEWTAATDAQGNPVGGYLVGLSNEMSGGNSGLLMYTRQTSITIDSAGKADSNTTVLNIDPDKVTVPLPFFTSRLTQFDATDSAIYMWKVVALPDTTGSTIGTGHLQVIADSDFGTRHGGGPAAFTMLADMPDISQFNFAPQPGPGGQPMDNMFADKDGDYYPDWIERALGTGVDDPGSFPNFTLDADLDGVADFLEKAAGSDPDDKASVPPDADNNGIPDTLEQRPEWDPRLSIDDDKDGYPTEIEMLFGTDPWNPDSKPTRQVKPSVPDGTYKGFVEFHGGNTNEQRKIYLTVYSDSSGKDWVQIDSTEIKGLARDGTNLRAELKFVFGEWTFFAEFSSGINAGNYLKVRFKSMGQEISGPVDLADMVGGGGPFVGHFVASSDPNFDFSNPAPAPTPGPGGPGVVDPNNVNLGPAPSDFMTKPDTGFMDIYLTIQADSMGGPAKLTLIIDGDTLVDPEGFWQPGQWPAIFFKFEDQTAGERLDFDGNLHRSGDPASGNDTLVLVGPLRYENFNAGEFNHYDFTLLNANYGNVKAPTGTWTGWIKPITNMGPPPNNQGPLPFIGMKTAVTTAMTATGGKAKILKDSTTGILDIIDTWQDNGNIWHCMTSDSSKYFIMEDPMDLSKVLVEEVNGQKVIIIGTDMGGSGMMGPMPFDGPQSDITAALQASGNMVWVEAPTPWEIEVDPASLQYEADTMSTKPGMYVIGDAANQSKAFVFLADHVDPAKLFIHNGRPMVMDAGGHQQQPGDTTQHNNPGPPPAFEGEQTKIDAALQGSNNVAVVDGAAPRQVTLDAASVILFTDPQDSSTQVWIAHDATDSTKEFLFLGQHSDPMMLQLKNNMPTVAELQQQPGPGPIDTTQPPGPGPNPGPYAGAQTLIDSVLVATQNTAVVKDSSGEVQITVDAATLTSMPDPHNSSAVIWLIEDAAKPGEPLVFLADPGDPAKLALSTGGYPVLMPQMAQPTMP